MKKLGVALISLLVGGLIYILFRDETLLMFVWFDWLGLNNFFGSLRDITLGSSYLLPNWFFYSLPNALWLFSGLLIFDFIWGPKITVNKMVWLVFFWSIAVGTEMSQALQLVQGTFDWQDMFFMTLASFCAVPFVVPSIQEERRKLA